jgi:hypothetical protein
MSFSSIQHKKLPNGSIDYQYYDNRARELRSADAFELARNVSLFFSVLWNQTVSCKNRSTNCANLIDQFNGQNGKIAAAEVHHFPNRHHACQTPPGTIPKVTTGNQESTVQLKEVRENKRRAGLVSALY